MTALATLTETRAPDHRGSWVPTGSMIRTRIMEIRRRRGLMIALAVVLVGLPTLFLTVRLIAHAVAPKSYGPAGGYDIFTNIVTGVMYVFGFIVAATVGASAGANDLSEGMFRHLVVTGRSRLAIYFARIPAGLAIVGTMLAAGFTIVCLVTSFAAPTHFTYDGMRMPAQMSKAGFETWSADHFKLSLCNLPSNIGCGPRGLTAQPNGTYRVTEFQQAKDGFGGPVTKTYTVAQLQAQARVAAANSYGNYSKEYLNTPISVMVQSGLWLMLEAAIGFVVGLGLASLMGQRTVPIVLLIILEVILTPLFSYHVIPYMLNAERGIVGVAMAHIEPHALPSVFGQGSGPNGNGIALVPETTTWSWVTICAWLVGWTGLGAWRMARRDA